MTDTYRNFTIYTLLSASLIIALVISLNVYLTFFRMTGEDYEISSAIKWQQLNQAVVAMGSNESNKYKARMTDHVLRTQGIETLILGSSTVMGLRPADLSSNRPGFNGAKNSNMLTSTISEAKHYLENFENINFLSISIDWALGFPYLPFEVVSFNPYLVSQPGETFWGMIKDAVSLQRVKVTAANLFASVIAGGKIVYDCPNETSLGMDILTQDHPRICYGFRADGSGTFARYSPLTQRELSQRLTLQMTERYRDSLQSTKGVIDARFLHEMQAIDAILKARSGKLLILAPPLMPGMVEYLRALPEGEYLDVTLRQITEFAQSAEIEFVDASASEKYGCDYDEFIDSHHALPDCYRKVMATIEF